MTENKGASPSAWTDPDDAPELTDAWFDAAARHIAGKPAPRGRPRLDAPKQAITVRLDTDVIEGLKAIGPDWRAQMNDALRAWLAKR